MSLFAPTVGTEADGGGLASVPLERFLSGLPEGTRRVYDAGADGGPPIAVRWAEPSELEDPTPYLLEHEVVLTAGLPFVGDGGAPDAVDRYVERLTRVSVSALVFGLDPYFDEVPAALLAACRRHRLTLVSAPAEIPFAALGLQFARLLEAENVRVMRQMAEGNRRLMRAALAPRPEADLLEALMRTVPGWALVVGANRRTRARAVAAKSRVGVPAQEVLDDVVGRLFAGRGPRVETRQLAPEGGGWIVAHPLRGARDETLGALVLGAEAPLDAAGQSVVGTAVGLLEALLRQRTEGALAPSQLATGLLLRPDHPGAAERREVVDLAAQSASAPSGSRLRVVHGFRADGRPGPTARRDRSGAILQWRRIFDTKLVELTDFGFTAITRLNVEPAVVNEVEALGWRLAVSDPVEVPELPEEHRRLAVLRARAFEAGRTLRASGDPVSVPSLLGRQAGELLFEHAFGPLGGLESDRAAALLDVLEAWLRAHGGWDATAKATGLHRNSVRRQIAQVGELIGRDLSDAGTRAELLIALRYRPSSYVGVPGGAAGR
ncbi:PucR family transcriptional regulator [Zhihengliuella salsuginis]|uniref:PucR family transcriptional regulator n=1 Tax=Zhihengliuella salsuginis TaxID=578222 RepID=A0ABQ3GLZ3_9MICC|nr:PucR family transcriptional regulator [Zhihengliuella salsuginis]GHD12509.1 PucR family transcriptional regulator [Zhihengliuella salsuginis]